AAHLPGDVRSASDGCFLDTEVQLLIAGLQPESTTIPETFRFVDFRQPHNPAPERASSSLGSGRNGDLDVVNTLDHLFEPRVISRSDESTRLPVYPATRRDHDHR